MSTPSALAVFMLIHNLISVGSATYGMNQTSGRISARPCLKIKSPPFDHLIGGGPAPQVQRFSRSD
jgi:hypothetical protein